LPRLLGQAASAVQTLPGARTLPSARTSRTLQAEEEAEVSGDEAPRHLLRRRRRAQTATIRSTSDLLAALGTDGFSPEDVSVISLCILRPPRVVLTTAQGQHSLCLPRDYESRIHFVLAGLPAGPTLPRDECCAICLEPFQTNEQVQLTASCRHAFHAGCIKMLLRSQSATCLAGDFHTPCPLCRSPIMAPSLANVPHRERPFAVTVNVSWLQTEMESADNNEGVVKLCCFAAPKHVGGNSTARAFGAALRRALTAPLDITECKRPGLLRRAGSATVVERLSE